MADAISFRSLLVPLDGSPFSECAMPWAASLAERMGAEIHIAQVIPPPAQNASDSDGSIESKRSKARDYLEGLANQLRELRKIRVRTVVLEHRSPASALKDHVESEGIDLILASTHGKGALGVLWLGSVTYELLATLSRPILLVRPHGSSAGLAAKPAMKQMLITLDGSERAEKILGPAVALGRAFGLEFTLLRVVDEHSSDHDGRGFSAGRFDPGQSRRVKPRTHDQAAAYLEAVALRLRQEGLRVESYVTADFDAGAAILRAMAEPAFDCIALEAQKKRGPARLVFGSVARRIIHAAAVPILIHSATADEPATIEAISSS
jgi:nucleotide-binding universal stress UspA family protein